MPNFSEGRDPAKVASIRKAMSAIPGVQVLRSELDPDHNRSVITIAGEPRAVQRSAFAGIEQATELINLSSHEGVHPRIGAADVVPFVPLSGVSMQECAELARELGRDVWEKLRIPVFFYEAAAANAERAPLEVVRRGGLVPDLGGPNPHPTAGACVIGARKILIAFNVNLNTGDVAIAKGIARRVRASSGGLPFVKAIGLELASRGLCQVSMNLTDFEQTPLHVAFQAVVDEARNAGVTVAGSEIIGLLPRAAVEQAAAYFLRAENFDTSLVIENKLDHLE